MDSKGLALGRVGVILVEVIDEFLHADGVLRGQVPVGDVAAGDGVRAGVHVQGEGGEMIVFGINEGIDAVVLEEHISVGLVVRRRQRSGSLDGGRCRRHLLLNEGALLSRRRGAQTTTSQRQHEEYHYKDGQGMFTGHFFLLLVK